MPTTPGPKKPPYLRAVYPLIYMDYLEFGPVGTLRDEACCLGGHRILPWMNVTRIYLVGHTCSPRGDKPRRVCVTSMCQGCLDHRRRLYQVDDSLQGMQELWHLHAAALEKHADFLRQLATCPLRRGTGDGEAASPRTP
jgi:hypothetical protein